MHSIASFIEVSFNKPFSLTAGYANQFPGYNPICHLLKTSKESLSSHKF
jgi:hypothetical protein